MHIHIYILSRNCAFLPFHSSLMQVAVLLSKCRGLRKCHTGTDSLRALEDCMWLCITPHFKQDMSPFGRAFVISSSSAFCSMSALKT